VLRRGELRYVADKLLMSEFPGGVFRVEPTMGWSHHVRCALTKGTYSAVLRNRRLDPRYRCLLLRRVGHDEPFTPAPVAGIAYAFGHRCTVGGASAKPAGATILGCRFVSNAGFGGASRCE